VLNKWRGVWSNTAKVLPVSKIQSVVGIWPAKTWIYILRKHPAVSLLSEEECRKEQEEVEEEG